MQCNVSTKHHSSNTSNRLLFYGTYLLRYLCKRPKSKANKARKETLFIALDMPMSFPLTFLVPFSIVREPDVPTRYWQTIFVTTMVL